MISFSVDMRNDMSPIRDQKRRPTCLAFSASDAHAMVHPGPRVELSAEYAHYSACKRMPTFEPSNATTPAAMLEALRLDGQPPEVEWPYFHTLPADPSAYIPPASVSGIVSHAGEELSSLDLAEDVLRAGWPVIMGAALSEAFYRLVGGSILPADPDARIRGYHAILGIGLFSSPAGNGYLIRNSWGSHWGQGGYGLITRTYLEPRILFLGVFRV
jgi:hypothetical protein